MQKDKLLFTPGPLTTSETVKAAMNRDLGSRDYEFIQAVKEIRESLLKTANLQNETLYDAILMQGAGTFGVESVISTVIPKDGHLLVVQNGAYGERIAHMARIHQIETSVLSCAENEIPQVDRIETFLKENPTVSHVAIVHCETTTGIFNEIESVGNLLKKYKLTYIVDAMSSFGAVPIDFVYAGIDYLISSSNKCIEGVPGFSFVIANTNKLVECKGQSRTLSLDLLAQWEGLNSNGQFRFTPPIQSLLAFRQALKELDEEGGVIARADRYKRNYLALEAGMSAMGFKQYLRPENRGYIITSFLYPEDNTFDFNQFYEALNAMGLVIYPGKLSQADCFRIGNIGKLHPENVDVLLAGIESVISKSPIVSPS